MSDVFFDCNRMGGECKWSCRRNRANSYSEKYRNLKPGRVPGCKALRRPFRAESAWMSRLVAVLPGRTGRRLFHERARRENR